MNKVQLPPAIFLMGPTGAGKTDLAVKLVHELPCEIISVDSAMVFRDMNIGTAKPTADILSQAPHRLIDICEPSEVYSAANFRKDALKEMAVITAAGRIPLLVGGTGLYFRSLEQGLSDLPPSDPEIRAQLNQEMKLSGPQVLHERLSVVDPESAKRIHPNDTQRIQRALEIHMMTGETMTTLQARTTGRRLPYELTKLALAPKERTVLHQRIENRFYQMLHHGLIEEVETLYNRKDLNPDMPSMRIVGYRQVWQFLAGDISKQLMIEKAVIATRQLAKRQFTWFRSEADLLWFDTEKIDYQKKIMELLEKTHSH